MSRDLLPLDEQRIGIDRACRLIPFALGRGGKDRKVEVRCRRISIAGFFQRIEPIRNAARQRGAILDHQIGPCQPVRP